MKKFVSPRAVFKGELQGIKVEDLAGCNYDLLTFEERIQFINSKLEQVDAFFTEYFYKEEDEDIEYFKCNLNKTDELSLDVNICKIIESYAIYLANSPDLGYNEVEKYVVLKEKEFKEILKKESLTDFKATNTVLDTRPSNYYCNIDLTVGTKDMNPELQKNKYGIREKDLELAAVLQSYEKMRVHLKGEMAKIKNKEESYLTLLQTKSLLAGLLGDIYDAKRMILGIRCSAKRLGDESPKYEFSAIDYSNKEHIKHCLRVCKMGTGLQPDNMCSHIAYDLKNSVDRLYSSGKIDDIDLEIIECYNSNYTVRQIASEIKKDTKTVQQRLDKICRRITKVI